MNALTQEEIRLAEVQSHQAHWRRWGPYLSDRQWGTVQDLASYEERKLQTTYFRGSTYSSATIAGDNEVDFTGL